jgi:aminopeptidase N
LIDDAFNFARVMVLDFQTVLGLLEYLKNELDYIPWATADRVLSVVDRRIASLKNYYPQFQTFVLNTVTPIFNKLGVHNVEDEPLLDRLARNIAVQWACYVGLEDCQKAATRRIEEYIQTQLLFEPDNLRTTFCAGLRGASQELGMDLWELMQTTRVIATRNMLIDALACAHNKKLLNELLDTIIRVGTTFTSAERNRLLSGIANNGVVGMQAVLQFLEANMEAARARVFLVPAVNNMASWISNQEDLDRVRREFDT